MGVKIVRKVTKSVIVYLASVKPCWEQFNFLLRYWKNEGDIKYRKDSEFQ
jgi:hypothetical protein